jgi:hypothetical protein
VAVAARLRRLQRLAVPEVRAVALDTLVQEQMPEAQVRQVREIAVLLKHLYRELGQAAAAVRALQVLQEVPQQRVQVAQD